MRLAVILPTCHTIYHWQVALATTAGKQSKGTTIQTGRYFILWGACKPSLLRKVYHGVVWPLAPVCLAQLALSRTVLSAVTFVEASDTSAVLFYFVITFSWAQTLDFRALFTLVAVFGTGQ